MAYLVTKPMVCKETGCTSRAEAELMSQMDTSMGAFCLMHGQKRMEELDAEEEMRRDRARISPKRQG